LQPFAFHLQSCLVRSLRAGRGFQLGLGLRAWWACLLHVHLLSCLWAGRCRGHLVLEADELLRRLSWKGGGLWPAASVLHPWQKLGS
jgi:hypothetical protein